MTMQRIKHGLETTHPLNQDGGGDCPQQWWRRVKA